MTLKSLTAVLLLFSVSSVYAYKTLDLKQKTFLSKQEVVNTVLNNMVYLKQGSFVMGAPGKKYYDFLGDNVYQHDVKLNGFYMSDKLTSATLYYSYLKQHGKYSQKKAESRGMSFNNRAALDTWKNANGYCQWLGKETGLPFALPTEAQWEYAARNGGDQVAYATNNGLLEPGANYPLLDSFKMQSANHDQVYVYLDVNGLPVNKLGLHQMSGNSYEWMHDWYSPAYYHDSKVVNPSGPRISDKKSIRGVNNFMMRTEDNWRYEASTYARDKSDPKEFDVAFRCVINSEKPISELKAIAKAHVENNKA